MQAITPRSVHVPALPRLPKPLPGPLGWLASVFVRTVAADRTPRPEPTVLPEQDPALPWWFDQSLM